MKITKQKLGQIHSLAVDKTTELAKGDLNHQEYLAKVWLEACADALGISGMEYPTRSIPEPTEE
jgi:hypothetical protein